MTNFQKVQEFMDAFGQTERLELIPAQEDSNIPALKLMDLRFKLICEEWNELVSGIHSWLRAVSVKRDVGTDVFFRPSRAEIEDASILIIDALVDLLYVTYGAFNAFGIDADEAFRRVHVSNMSKLGADGKPIYRDDGKVLKGPNFEPPHLSDLLHKKNTA